MSAPAIRLTRNGDGTYTLPGYAVRAIRDFVRALGGNTRDAGGAFVLARKHPVGSESRRMLEVRAREGDYKARWTLTRVNAAAALIPVLEGLPDLSPFSVRGMSDREKARVKALQGVNASTVMVREEKDLRAVMGRIAAYGRPRGSTLVEPGAGAMGRTHRIRRNLVEWTKYSQEVERAMRAAHGTARQEEVRREHEFAVARVERLQRLIVQAERLVEAARTRDAKGGVRHFERVCVANDRLWKLEQEQKEIRKSLDRAGRLYTHLASDAVASRIRRLAKQKTSYLLDMGLSPAQIVFVRNYMGPVGLKDTPLNPFTLPNSRWPGTHRWGSREDIRGELGKLDAQKKKLDTRLKLVAMEGSRPLATTFRDAYMKFGYSPGRQADYEAMIQREWRTIFVKRGTPRGYYTEAQLREIYHVGNDLFARAEGFLHDEDDRAYQHSLSPTTRLAQVRTMQNPRVLQVRVDRGLYLMDKARRVTEKIFGHNVTRTIPRRPFYFSSPGYESRIDTDQFLRRFTRKDSGALFPEMYDEHRERVLQSRDDWREILFSLPEVVRPYDLAAKYDPRWKPSGRIWFSFGRDVGDQYFTMLQEHAKYPHLAIHHFGGGEWGAAAPGPWKALSKYMGQIPLTQHPDQITPIARALFWYFHPGGESTALSAYNEFLKGGALGLDAEEAQRIIAGPMAKEAREAFRMLAVRAQELGHPDFEGMEGVSPEMQAAHSIRQRAVSGFAQTYGLNTALAEAMSTGLGSWTRVGEMAETLGLDSGKLRDVLFADDERFAANPTGIPRPRTRRMGDTQPAYEAAENESLVRQRLLATLLENYRYRDHYSAND